MSPRLLHVAETLQGGIATYLGELLSWQVRRHGIGSVGLIAPREQLSSLPPKLLAELRVFDYHRRGRDLRSLRNLRTTFVRTLSTCRPDIVHAHSSFAGAVCRLQRQTPVVYTPHGWAFAMTLPTAKRMFYTQVERWLSHRSAAIIAVSRHERELALAAGLPDDRIVHVRTGLSDKPLPSAPSSTTKGRPLSLLFIGRFDRQKGLDWLLDALSPLPSDSYQLTALGTPVQDRPRTHFAGPQVHCPGWVTAAQIDTYLDQADALVIPSRWEAFGLVALEAMRRSKAVLASRVGALPEIVQEGETGYLFDLENSEGFRKLILSLDPEHLAAMGSRGRLRFTDHFEASRMCLEIDSIYNRIRTGPSKRLKVENATNQPSA